MSIAKCSHFPNGHSLRQVYDAAEKIDWDELSLFYLNVLLGLEKSRNANRYKQFSPPFKKFHGGVPRWLSRLNF